MTSWPNIPKGLRRGMKAPPKVRYNARREEAVTMGTYALQGIGVGHTGHVYMLSREEIERLIGSRTDGPYRITNVVTRKAVKVSDRRPLTAADVARISNDDR